MGGSRLAAQKLSRLCPDVDTVEIWWYITEFEQCGADVSWAIISYLQGFRVNSTMKQMKLIMS